MKTTFILSSFAIVSFLACGGAPEGTSAGAATAHSDPGAVSTGAVAAAEPQKVEPESAGCLKACAAGCSAAGGSDCGSWCANWCLWRPMTMAGDFQEIPVKQDAEATEGATSASPGKEAPAVARWCSVSCYNECARERSSAECSAQCCSPSEM